MSVFSPKADIAERAWDVVLWPSMIGNRTSDRVQLSDGSTAGKELQGDPSYEALFQTGEHSVLGRRIANTEADRHTKVCLNSG
jgi:hypothetical protein